MGVFASLLRKSRSSSPRMVVSTECTRQRSFQSENGLSTQKSAVSCSATASKTSSSVMSDGAPPITTPPSPPPRAPPKPPPPNPPAALAAAGRCQEARANEPRHDLPHARCIDVDPLGDGLGRDHVRAVVGHERQDVARCHELGGLHSVSFTTNRAHRQEAVAIFSAARIDSQKNRMLHRMHMQYAICNRNFNQRCDNDAIIPQRCRDRFTEGMRTRITELLAIRYPIVQGGMTWVGR